MRLPSFRSSSTKEKDTRRSIVRPFISSIRGGGEEEVARSKIQAKRKLRERLILRRSGGGSSLGFRCSGSSMSMRNCVPQNSKNEGIVEDFIEEFNKHNVDACIALTTSESEWKFRGEAFMTIKHKEFGGMMQTMIDSFPDFSIHGDKAIEVGPGTVEVRNSIASGTHTGKPFGFASFNPLTANGVKCVNQPEHLTFFVNRGKIVQVHVVCTGPLCGPMGFYKQIKDAESQ